MKSTYFKRTGHDRYRVAKKSTNSAATGRRERAKKRLEEQLGAGTKTARGSLEAIPLEDKDKTRIKREIDVLKGRL